MGWIAAGHTGRSDRRTEDAGGGQGDGFLVWSGADGTVTGSGTSGQKAPAGRVTERGLGGRMGLTVDAAKTVLLSNLNPDPPGCTAEVEPARGVIATVCPASVEFEGGGIAEFTIGISEEDLQPGQHEGYIRLNCGDEHPAVRILYWMGVSTGKPSGMERTDLTASGKAGRTLYSAARYRIWDEAGLPLDDHAPVVTVVEGTGRVVGFWETARVWPGQYAIHVSPGPGRNVFRVQFGSLSQTFEVQGEP